MPKLKFITIQCPTCDGAGYVRGELDYDHNGSPIQDFDDCPKCHGEGTVQMPVTKEEYDKA